MKHSMASLSYHQKVYKNKSKNLTGKEGQDSHQSSHQSIYWRNIKQHLVAEGRRVRGRECCKRGRGNQGGENKKTNITLKCDKDRTYANCSRHCFVILESLLTNKSSYNSSKEIFKYIYRILRYIVIFAIYMLYIYMCV